MPRQKVVTAEAIVEVIRKMKRLKAFQRGKFQVGERADGQPIYHWPKISKAKIARQLGVQADYLTDLQRKDESIKNALLHVGQPRGSVSGEEAAPKANTKAYYKKRYDEVQVENKRLNIRLSNCLKKNKELALNQTSIDEVLENNEKLITENKQLRQVLIRLESEIKGLKVKNASLETQLVLAGKDI